MIDQMLNEISTTRLMNHLSDNKTLAMISIYRSEGSECENRSLLFELKQIVKTKLKLRFSEFISRWAETDEKTNKIITSDERILMIYDISLNKAIELGQKYNQSSIIFKSKDQCTEVCVTPFVDWKGKKYNVNDIVRVFFVKSKTAMNINIAKDIFQKRISGPASMPIKGNRLFTLKNVYEVESPTTSVFATSEKLYRVF